MPMASATAMTPRALAGTMADENSGASTNSGDTRASTRKKRHDLLLAELGDEVLEAHPPTRAGIWP